MNTTIASNATQLLVSENILQSHGEDLSPTAAIVLCVIALLVITGILVVNFSVVKVAIFACILIAVIIFLVYASMLYRRDKMDYEGLMRITSVDYMERLESRMTETCKPNYDNGYGSDTQTSRDTNNQNCVKKTSYTLKLEAVYSLDWGYDWACPADSSSLDQPSAPKKCRHWGCAGDSSSSSLDQPPAPKQCRSRVRTCEQTICHRRTCSARDHDSALQKALNCVFQQGWGFDEARAARNDYVPYDPLVGPRQDVDWPSLIAFGDCNTCEVALPSSVASPKTIRGVKTAGFVFLGIGGVVLAIAFVVTFGADVLQAIKRKIKKCRSPKMARRRKPQHKPVLPIQEYPVQKELKPVIPQPPIQEDETIQEDSKSSSSFVVVSARHIKVLPRSESSNSFSTTSTSQFASARQDDFPTSV